MANSNKRYYCSCMCWGPSPSVNRPLDYSFCALKDCTCTWVGGWVGGWMDGWMDGWMEEGKKEGMKE